MTIKKSLQELCLIDDFLFFEVLQDKTAAKYLIEIILDKKISYVTESKPQEEIKTSPHLHGIRMDVYIEDDRQTVYNVEVQVKNPGNIPKRSRYYQSLIDYKRLPSGEINYNLLPASYIIFICDFDPYGQGRYKYEFEYRCLQDLSLPFGDQAIKMILNARGSNDAEVNPALIRLLRYIVDTSDANADKMPEEAIKYLQEIVYKIKHSEEKEAAYMKFQEMMMIEREEGRREGRLEGKQDTARNLLAEGLDVRMIARVTGLTEAEIRGIGGALDVASGKDAE